MNKEITVLSEREALVATHLISASVITLQKAKQETAIAALDTDGAINAVTEGYVFGRRNSVRVIAVNTLRALFGDDASSANGVFNALEDLAEEEDICLYGPTIIKQYCDAIARQIE
ncbi:MAG: hypothetical protein LBK23_04645 [Oscillospiraceae bacterium]|jgi:hypothetical protein|nr:hypothetical protein [Oscillospiraceae bacterium]